MRKYTLFLLFSILAVSVIRPEKARASHAAGGEIIYEWLSDSTYRFFFKFYRDCSGIPEETSKTLCSNPTPAPGYSCPNITSFNTTMNKWTGTVPPGVPNGSPVAPGCTPSLYPTTCDVPGSSLPGYREWWYSAIVTLPGQCNYWTFSTDVSGRNPQNNLVSIGTMYIECTYNNLFFQGPTVVPFGNSSPYFSIKPVPYVCVNTAYQFNNGAIDPNGDSLVTDLAMPANSNGIGQCPMPFSPAGLVTGLNLINNPFPTGNSFVINPSSGQMSFTATQTGTYTITTRVREYRYGLLIGYILRDVQVRVLNCTANTPSYPPPIISDPNSVYLNGRINGCPNQPINFCFDIKTIPGNILVATDNHIFALPAATMTYANQNTDSIRACFSWTPLMKDTGLKSFILIVKDSTCKPPGIMMYYTRSIDLYIWAPTIAVSSDTAVCPKQPAFLSVKGGANFSWSVLSGTPGSLNCTNCFNPVATPLIDSRYVVTSTVNPFCPNSNKDTIDIKVYPAPNFTPHNDTTTCPHNDVMLDLKGAPPSGVTYSYKWTPNLYLSNDTVVNPVVTPNATTTYRVVIKGSDSKCLAHDTITVDVLNGFLIENHDTDICEGQTVTVRGAGDPRYTLLWSTSVVPPGGAISPDNTYTPIITPIQVGKFSYILTASYYANNVKACNDSVYTFNINVQPIPTVKVDDDAILCYGDTMKLHGLVTPAYPYTLSWTPGVSLDEPNKANPLFTGNVIGINTLTLTASSSAGCADSDQVVLTVFPAKFLEISPDTAICPGDSVQIHMTATGAKSFKWIPDINISNTKGLDPLVWPIATQTYTVFGVDTNSCYDTQRVRITVKPAAFMHLPDSVRLYPGDSYQVDPAGNCLYFNWFPNVGLNRADIANPIAKPAVNTRYVVKATTEFGCTITDSLDIIVMPDSYIDMPNAFSPGAGPNKYLKPIHLGTATLKRFEVYNRWGKKMFETNNINEGWDGRFNDQPQPLGVYVYYLEALTPAGKTIIKQGNVTLLR